MCVSVDIKIIYIYSTFRVYIGYIPTVQVSDLEMLKEVFVKKFSSFTNRPVRVRAGSVCVGVQVVWVRD